MLTDLDCANLCQAQYDDKAIFNYVFSTAGVDYAIKYYSDCLAVVFEGSHDLPDWVSNFKGWLVDVPDFAGVEKGFYDGMPDVAAQAIPLLNKKLPVFVTGHSRGAAHAHIFAAMLIKRGFQVFVVVFGSPRPGDATLAAILAHAPCHSYRNYKGFDEQDFVCDVPFPLHFLGQDVLPFVTPPGHVTIKVEPMPDDEWGLLAWHHLPLYIEGVQPGWRTY